MIDTTSVDGPANGFSIGAGFAERSAASARPPAWRRRRYPCGDGLRRTPLAASARISSEGCGSITTTRLASSPCASQPDSIAPPIFPAPARTMVPWMILQGVSWCSRCHRQILSSSLRKQGPITTGVSSETQDRPQALCLNIGDTAYGSRALRAGRRRDVRGAMRADRRPTPRPRCRTSPHSWLRRRSCRPRPRTGTPDNSARRRGWRRPACSRIARSRR